MLKLTKLSRCRLRSCSPKVDLATRTPCNFHAGSNRAVDRQYQNITSKVTGHTKLSGFSKLDMDLTPDFDELLRERKAAPTRQQVTLDSIDGFLREALRIVGYSINCRRHAELTEGRTPTLRDCIKTFEVCGGRT